MKKLILAATAIFALTGCSLLSPYSVTFTTPENSVIDPTSDTLDLAVNIPTMAYISEVECLGHEPMELLPVVTDEMTVKKAHNISLELLEGYSAGTQCEVTVTVFDQTTTATTRESINLHVLEILTPDEESSEEEVIEENLDEGICDDGSFCEAPAVSEEEDTAVDEEVVDETNDEVNDEINNDAVDEDTTSEDSSEEESEA